MKMTGTVFGWTKELLFLIDLNVGTYLNVLVQFFSTFFKLPLFRVLSHGEWCEEVYFSGTIIRGLTADDLVHDDPQG